MVISSGLRPTATYPNGFTSSLTQMNPWHKNHTYYNKVYSQNATVQRLFVTPGHRCQANPHTNMEYIKLVIQDWKVNMRIV